VTTATAGAGVVDDIAGLAESLRHGDWLDAGLGGASTAMDVVGAAIDPIGTLAAAGLGWLMEHLNPLHSWLQDLSGSAEGVERFAHRWESIGAQLGDAADDLRHRVTVDLELMTGAALDAYRAHADGLVHRLGALGAAASAVAQALRVASTVIGTVAGMVRDALAQVVGSAISAFAEEGLSLGLATPLVATQIATKVARLASHVGSRLHALISSVRALNAEIGRLEVALRRLGHLAIGQDVHVPVRSDGSFARGATRPSRVKDSEAGPRGSRTKARRNADANMKRALARENEAAETLARHGYDVEQNPSVPGAKNPDYRVEGEVFDCLAPISGRASGIRRALLDKLNEGQASRFVVNLDDTSVEARELERVMAEKPLIGVQEVIAIKNGAVIHILT
jgi:hypothetical protein